MSERQSDRIGELLDDIEWLKAMVRNAYWEGVVFAYATGAAAEDDLWKRSHTHKMLKARFDTIPPNEP